MDGLVMFNMMMMMILLDVLVMELRLLVGHMFLMIFGHVFLDVHMDGLLHWDFHGVRNVFLDFDGHLLDHGVGLWHMNLNLIGHWLVNVHGHRTIIGHMHGNGHLLDHRHGYGFVHIVRYWLVHMVGYWLLDGHLDGVVNNLLDGVWFVDMHVLLNLIVDNLFNWVWCGNMNLNGHMNLLLYWVWGRHMNLRGKNGVSIVILGVPSLSLYTLTGTGRS